ncbi:hypothetical protein [Cohnella rhizosphaerae]|uniref:Uncharacterized protein n=1 Tax=Cohnella rhizosphaerae TaxID=1457232 RepID=A0A9X4KZM6_9BACL|nr:hypothetical protein [Cohnella rhizosphaerae]MDG0810742.1 hypothetical protein [Cohnella rhizosphaerae]
MANYVTISCLGPRPLAVPAEVSDEEAILRMIAHWQAQLDRVLPDRPDLIVLPEACDRPDPLTFPLDRRLSYYRARKDRIRDFFAGVARRHGLLRRLSGAYRSRGRHLAQRHAAHRPRRQRHGGLTARTI